MSAGTPPFVPHISGGIPAVMGVVGTLGTADTGGTSETLPVGVNPATGAMYVEDLSGALGTTNVLVVGGTLNAGTVVQSSGTTTLVSTVTTLSNLTNGSVNVLTGTIQNSGTVTGVGVVSVLTVGTVGGKAASGAAAVSNPVLIGGTDSGGTVYSPLLDTAGNYQIDVITVPQVSIGTIPQVSVGTLPTLNVTTGTITTGSLSNIGQVHNAGTLAAGGNNIGDVDVATGTVTLLSTVTTLSNLTNGSVNVLTGTIQNSGTTTGVGVVSALTVGTIGGKAASGAAAVANPVLIGGTDSGGTVYVPLVTTGGILAANMPTGTVTTGTILSSGTTTGVGVVSNLTTGSINVLTGTIQSAGTTTGVGVVSNLTNGSINVLTGTIQSAGTTTGVGVVSSLTNGSINVLTGTVTSVTNLAGGTVQINKTPVQIGTPFVVRGTTGAAVWGTIIAASGAGTKQYVSRSSIIVEAGTVDCAITYVGVGGSEGAGVLERGKFVPSAGITNNHDPVISSGTNGTIGYWMGGAGTAIFTINYWQTI